jgi:hypothetical protein
VVASAPVIDNIYAATDLPQGDAVTVAALDASGKVIYERPLDR